MSINYPLIRLASSGCPQVHELRKRPFFSPVKHSNLSGCVLTAGSTGRHLRLVSVRQDELAATTMLAPRGREGRRERGREVDEELARGMTTQSYQAQGNYHIITLSETIEKRLSIRQCRIVT